MPDAKKASRRATSSASRPASVSAAMSSASASASASPLVSLEGARGSSRRAAASASPAGLDASGLTHLVGYAASRAAIEMRKVFTRQMKPLDLKIVDFSILMLVAANPQVNQKQIGQALDLSPPNMAVTLDRLVERGWVQRVRSERDRRAQHIHLTAAGRALVGRAAEISATMEDAALRMLSPAERALLIELLLKVAGIRPETD